jgi:hypothetical protein
MTPDLRTCVHEACHAVTARLLGLRVARATVDEQDPHVTTLHRNDLTALEALAVIDLAGTIMEDRPGPCAIDEAHAIARCERIVRLRHEFGESWDGFRDEAAALLEDLRGRALRLVADHLAQIGAVATALAREGQLDQAAIDALIAEVNAVGG